MAPGLCTVERLDLLMVVKMSDLNLSKSERLFIKPILAKWVTRALEGKSLA